MEAGSWPHLDLNFEGCPKTVREAIVTRRAETLQRLGECGELGPIGRAGRAEGCGMIIDRVHRILAQHGYQHPTLMGS